MHTLYNDMCNTLSCQSCDLTLIALFYLRTFFVFDNCKDKKKQGKKHGFFTSLGKTFMGRRFTPSIMYAYLFTSHYHAVNGERY